MKLTDQEKEELLADGRDIQRRENFRAAGHPRGPLTFESYLLALDDLQRLKAHTPRPFRIYTQIKL